MIKLVIALVGVVLLSGCGPTHNIYIGDTFGSHGISVSVVNGQTSIGLSGNGKL